MDCVRIWLLGIFVYDDIDRIVAMASLDGGEPVLADVVALPAVHSDLIPASTFQQAGILCDENDGPRCFYWDVGENPVYWV